MFGGETLYQLRAALQLAETEREGVSTSQVQLKVVGVGKGGEYRAVLADLNTKGRNCSLNKFGNNFHFYFLDLKYVAGCFYSFH